MRRAQSGFTIIELIITIGFVIGVGIIGGGGYIAFHFLAKVW